MKIPYDTPLAVGQEYIVLKPDVLAAILVTLRRGWVHALSSADVNADADEVAITERLRDGMRHALTGCPWGKSMIIAPGTESRSRADVLRPDGRTDIPIYELGVFVRLGDHDPHAIIECKRVAGGDTHLCREYVVEGIDRFCTGKYGGRHALGLMAGYLMASDAGTAVAGINSYLSRHQRQPEHLRPSDILDDALAWQSHHPRKSPMQPIELFHAFLNFSRALN